MPNWPCAPSPMCPIPQGTPSVSLILTMIPLCPCPIVHVPHYCPCAPLAMCPITHVQHLPRCLISIFSIKHDTYLSTFPIAHMSKKDVKLSTRCQVVKKMSNVKESSTWTMEEVHKKKNWHNEVHTYWCQFWRHIWWWTEILKMCIESVFDQFWWPSYLTSKLTSICVNLIMCIYLFVNLLHSLCVWLFNIWHLFDILTSFWQFDIFFI